MTLAWFIFMTFVVIGFQSYIYHRWGLKNIEYRRSFSESAVVEGEKVEMIDEISNKKLLPVPWLRLESKISKHLQFQVDEQSDHAIDHGGFHRTLFSLMSYQRIRRRHQLTCTKRGHYRFGRVDLSTGDVFGFSEAVDHVEAEAEIIVYPKLVPLEEIPLPSHSWLGDVVVRRWIIEDPFLTSGVREYAPGDPLNAIHWKATARTNELQVSKRDFTSDHHLMIYLNFNQTGDIWMPIVDRDLIEESISYVASIAQYTIAKGIETGLGCNSYTSDQPKESIRIQPENSKQQLTYIFETLAKVEVASHESIDVFLNEDIEKKVRGTDILLVTSLMTDSMQERIEKLEELGNAVEVLLLESEEVRKKAI